MKKIFDTGKIKGNQKTNNPVPVYYNGERIYQKEIQSLLLNSIKEKSYEGEGVIVYLTKKEYNKIESNLEKSI